MPSASASSRRCALPAFPPVPSPKLLRRSRSRCASRSVCRVNLRASKMTADERLEQVQLSTLPALSARSATGAIKPVGASARLYSQGAFYVAIGVECRPSCRPPEGAGSAILRTFLALLQSGSSRFGWSRCKTDVHFIREDLPSASLRADARHRQDIGSAASPPVR